MIMHLCGWLVSMDVCNSWLLDQLARFAFDLVYTSHMIAANYQALQTNASSGSCFWINPSGPCGCCPCPGAYAKTQPSSETVHFPVRAATSALQLLHQLVTAYVQAHKARKDCIGNRQQVRGRHGSVGNRSMSAKDRLSLQSRLNGIVVRTKYLIGEVLDCCD